MTSTKGLGSLHQPVPDESLILFYTAIANNKVRQVHQMLEENARLVNYKNERHETALHIATHRKTDPSICELLLDYGADVNALNFWGQSPLHHAAMHGSVVAIKVLLHHGAITPKITDCNGYNALHCLVSNSDLYSNEWVDMFDTLIAAGIDINSQTRFGYHVLHRVAKKKDNTKFIKYILSRFPNVKANTLDQKGENFLHMYMKSERPDEIFPLVNRVAWREFASCSREN